MNPINFSWHFGLCQTRHHSDSPKSPYCFWQPEICEIGPGSIVHTPPLGQPDPEIRRPLSGMRPRVYKNQQVGPTCMYHAASRISPHFGEAEPLHHFRINEKILANFCHSMALITQIMQAPCADEWKTFKTVEFMSYLGLQTHYPYFAVCLVIANRQIYNQNPTILSQQPMVIYSQWQKILFDQMKNAYCTFTAYSLRLMLLRMSLLPLTWHPHAGPTCLIQALKTHLYAFVMGAFGKSTFRYLSQVDYHPKLGPIFGGPLLDFTPSSSSFFCNHAILLIGLRDRGSGHGEVYFIDPQDASGPGLLQTVYKMSMKDFFNRLRDSYGAHPSQPKTGEFVWVGHPALFLP